MGITCICLSMRWILQFCSCMFDVPLQIITVKRKKQQDQFEFAALFKFDESLRSNSPLLSAATHKCFLILSLRNLQTKQVLNINMQLCMLL